MLGSEEDKGSADQRYIFHLTAFNAGNAAHLTDSPEMVRSKLNLQLG